MNKKDIDIYNLKKSFKSTKYNYHTKQYDPLYLDEYLSLNRMLSIQTTDKEYFTPTTEISMNQYDLTNDGNYYIFNNNQQQDIEGGKVHIYQNTGSLDYSKYFIVNNYKKQIERMQPKIMKDVVDEFEFRFGKYIDIEDNSSQSGSKMPKKKVFKSDIGFVKFGKILKYMNERTHRLPNQYNYFKMDLEETLSISLHHKQLKKEEKHLQSYRIILNQEHIYHYYINNFIKYYIDKDIHNPIINSLKLCKKFKTDYTNTFESTNYDIRFSHNIEETFDLSNIDNQDINTIHYLNIFDERDKKFRFRKRYKFTKYDKNIGIYCLDLTIVKTNKYPAKSLNEIKESDYVIEYEMELELLYPTEPLLIDLQPNYYLFNVYEIMSELVLYRVLLDDNGFFLSNFDKKHLKYLYKELSGIKYYDFLGPKPEGFDINKAKNIDNSFSISIKADGERHLLMIIPNKKGKINIDSKYIHQIYLINNRLDVIPTGMSIISNSNLGYCLFDGEYMLNDSNYKKFYIFDVLFYNGNDVRNNDYYKLGTQNERYYLIEDFRNKYLQSGKIINSHNLYNYYMQSDSKILIDFTIEVKKTYIPDLEGKSIVELYDYLNKEEKFKSISNDGFILTKMDQPYPTDTRRAWMNTYKLKPKSQNTIDFMVNKFTKINRNGIDYMKIQLNCSRLISQNNYEFTPFIVDNSLYYKYQYEQISYMYVPIINNQILTSDNIEIFENAIIECKWEDFKSKQSQNPYLNNWYPLRMRLDKIELYFQSNTIRGTANNINIARNIWKELNEPDIQFDKLLKGYFGVKMDDSKTKEFEHVRKFHRLIKKHLISINLTENTKLIDFTCGRGSDMKNWLDLNIKNVIGYDIDYNSIYTYDKDGIYWRFFNNFQNSLDEIQNYNYLFINTNSSKETLYTLLFGKNLKKTTNSIIGNFNNRTYIHNIFYNNIIKEFNKQIFYLYKSKTYISKKVWNDDNKLEFNEYNINLFIPLIKDLFKQYGYEIDSQGYLYIRNNNKFNIATNFFSVHYFFNKKNDILQLMNNVSQILYIDNDFSKCGKWLITCIDGSKLIKKFGIHIDNYYVTDNPYIIKDIDNNTKQIIIQYTNNQYNQDISNIFKKIKFESEDYTYTEITRIFDENFILKYLSLNHLQNISIEMSKKPSCQVLLFDMYQIKMYEIGLKLFDRNVNQIIQSQISDDKLIKEIRMEFKKQYIKISNNNIMYNLGEFVLLSLYKDKVFEYIRNYIEIKYNELIDTYNQKYAKYHFFTKTNNNIINNITENQIKLNIEKKINIGIEYDNDIYDYVLINNTLLDYINDIIIGDKISVKVSSISNFAKDEPLVFDFGLNLYAKSFGLMTNDEYNYQAYQDLENNINSISNETIDLSKFKQFIKDKSFTDLKNTIMNEFHIHFYETLYASIITQNENLFTEQFLEIMNENIEFSSISNVSIEKKQQFSNLLYNTLIKISQSLNTSLILINNLNNLDKNKFLPESYYKRYCQFLHDKKIGVLFNDISVKKPELETLLRKLISKNNGFNYGLKEFSELHTTFTYGKCNVEEFINDRIYYTNYISQFISQSINKFGYNNEYIIIK